MFKLFTKMRVFNEGEVSTIDPINKGLCTIRKIVEQIFDYYFDFAPKLDDLELRHYPKQTKHGRGKGRMVGKKQE